MSYHIISCHALYHVTCHILSPRSRPILPPFQVEDAALSPLTLLDVSSKRVVFTAGGGVQKEVSRGGWKGRI